MSKSVKQAIPVYGGTSGGGHTIESAGSPLLDQPNLNFLSPISAADNPGASSTDVSIDLSGYVSKADYSQTVVVNSSPYVPSELSGLTLYLMAGQTIDLSSMLNGQEFRGLQTTGDTAIDLGTTQIAGMTAVDMQLSGYFHNTSTGHYWIIHSNNGLNDYLSLFKIGDLFYFEAQSFMGFMGGQASAQSLGENAAPNMMLKTNNLGITRWDHPIINVNIGSVQFPLDLNNQYVARLSRINGALSSDTLYVGGHYSGGFWYLIDMNGLGFILDAATNGYTINGLPSIQISPNAWVQIIEMGDGNIRVVDSSDTALIYTGAKTITAQADPVGNPPADSYYEWFRTSGVSPNKLCQLVVRYEDGHETIIDSWTV